MKKMMLILAACVSVSGYAQTENNAYIHIERSFPNGLCMFVLYDGHYYIAPSYFHSDDCPCNAD